MINVGTICRSFLLALLVPLVGHGAGKTLQSFQVFDALLYQNKPDLGSLGMRRIIQVNQPSGPAQQFDDAKIRDSLSKVRGAEGSFFLDYEVWPLTAAPPPTIAASVANFIRVAAIARDEAPKATFGFYGEIPCREYWGIVSADAKKLNAWKECNRQGEQVAAQVDVIFPSLYTFYNDQKSWDIYAQAMIDEARRYKKPVYVFLWPEFHVSNPLLRGTNIPAQFWRHQLEFCSKRADGIVIWGGFQEQWQEDAPWWLETKAFLAALGNS